MRTATPRSKLFVSFTFLQVVVRRSKGLVDQGVREALVVQGVLEVRPLQGILGDLEFPSHPQVPALLDVLGFRRLEVERVSFGLRLQERVDLVELGEDYHNRLLHMLGHRMDHR